jgi:hypothetical protein
MTIHTTDSITVHLHTEWRRLKLSDFGIAKWGTADLHGHHVCNTVHVYNTVHTAAQFQNSQSRKTDTSLVYSKATTMR